MKDQWAARHVLDTDTMKRCDETMRRVQGAAAQYTTNISAPAPKSDAATAEMTAKHSQETAQYLKEKQESSRSKQKIPDNWSFDNFSE